MVGERVGELGGERPDLATDAAEIVEQPRPVGGKLGEQRGEYERVDAADSRQAPFGSRRNERLTEAQSAVQAAVATTITMKPSASYAIGFAAAAVSGAAIAVGVVAAFGGLSTKTSTVREVISQAPASSPSTFASPSKALTVHQIYDRAAPGVVQVTSTSVHKTTDPFFGPFSLPQQQTEKALGSGFVMDKAGHIITNEHVVAGAKSVQVSFSDNESLKANIIGTDPSSDVAVLQVDARSRALTPLPLGDSDSVQVGDPVVAIGNPFGLDRSITAGIVSALQRPITAPNGFTIDHVIQTDAALNHGNSGGPLLNARGQVVGVNSQIQTDGGNGNVGVGFAIPIDTVKDVAAQLIKNGRAEHAFLGIEGKPVTAQVARLFHLPASHGVLVATVCRSSGAADSGLKPASTNVVVAGESWPLGGDLIVRADGVSVGSTDQLRSVVAARKPGDTVDLEVYRDAKKLNVHVQLGRQPRSLRC
jgi:S1-C subfamily serine protease